MEKAAISGRNDEATYPDSAIVSAIVTTSSHEVAHTDKNSIVSWSELSQMVDWRKDMSTWLQRGKVGSDRKELENTLPSRLQAVKERQFPLRIIG